VARELVGVVQVRRVVMRGMVMWGMVVRMWEGMVGVVGDLVGVVVRVDLVRMMWVVVGVVVRGVVGIVFLRSLRAISFRSVGVVLDRRVTTRTMRMGEYVSMLGMWGSRCLVSIGMIVQRG